MDLKGKKILVTGGSSGIGQAIVVDLAKEGAEIAFTYNKNEKGADETFEKIGGKGHKYKVDMRNEDEIKSLFSSIEKEFGSLDVLVNNAGVNRPRGLFNVSDWREIFDVDLFSIVSTTGLAVELMKHGGKILNVSSIYGYGKFCNQDLAPYGAAKSALNHYTEILAKNLAPKILVNAIAPGYVKTPLWGEKSEEEFEESGKEQLIERMIEPEEIAQMATAVIKSDAMTGEIVIVDGGLSLKTL